MRAETGSMQFGDDWPGVWIRGDDALWLANILRHAISAANFDEYHLLYKKDIRKLASVLGDCNALDKTPVRNRMKEYLLCVRGPCASCKHLMRDFNFTWAAACSKIDGPRWGERVGSEDGCEKWEELA